MDEAIVLLCRRRGAAIDLVLDRTKLSRSQFVFTNARGRPAVWWQTQQTAQFANPGARVPRGRASGPLLVAVDTREKYGWKFAGRQMTLGPRALASGDYAAIVEDSIVAVVERKTLANFATSLSDGSLAFQMQRLAEAGRSAVVVEGEYPDLFRTQPGRGSWLADMLAGWRCDIPRSRSSSPVRESSPRSGRTASSGQPRGTATFPPGTSIRHLPTPAESSKLGAHAPERRSQPPLRIRSEF